MDADERTEEAISITRTLLKWILRDSKAMIMFADSSVTPEDLSDDVYAVLSYLELTDPDKTKETEKQ